MPVGCWSKPPGSTAVITAALLAGTGADRMKFGSFLTFTALWALVVYVPLAHWVFSPTG